MEGVGVISGAGQDLKGPKDSRKAPCHTNSLLLSLPPSSLWSSEVSVEERRRKRLSAVVWGELVMAAIPKPTTYTVLRVLGGDGKNHFVVESVRFRVWKLRDFFLLCNIEPFREPRGKSLCRLLARSPRISHPATLTQLSL